MKLETERLILRPVTGDDAGGNYHEWLNDPEVVKYMEDRFYPADQESIKKYIETTANALDKYFFAVCLKASPQLYKIPIGAHIGNVLLGPIPKVHRYAEVSYTFHRSYWGNGYATEAVKAVVNFAFVHLDLERLNAGTSETNIPSQNVLKKAGFTREGAFRKFYWMPTGREDRVIWGQLKSEYHKV